MEIIYWLWNSPDVQSTDSSVEFYNILSDWSLLFYVLTISSNSFWKRLHNSKEIVNLQGLFVLTVGYLDITTYPLTKYYYVIKRAYFIYKFFIFLLFTSTFSFWLLLYAASWSYKNARIEILFYIIFYIVNAMKKH